MAILIGHLTRGTGAPTHEGPESPDLLNFELARLCLHQTVKPNPATSGREGPGLASHPSPAQGRKGKEAWLRDGLYTNCLNCATSDGPRKYKADLEAGPHWGSGALQV